MPSPTPLTGVQRRYSFEIAKVFYNTEAAAHDGFRRQYQWLTASDTNLKPIYDQMNNFLDTLVDTDVDTSAIVVDILADWANIRKDTYRFDGQIGSFGNVHYDPEEDRVQLAKLFSYYVPLMPLAMAHIHKMEAEQNAGATSTNTVIRNLM